MMRVRPLYYNGNLWRKKGPRLRRKTHMTQEIEIKLRVKDANHLRAALKRMGARLVTGGNGRVHEWNTVFDTPRQDLRKREELLRIRMEMPDRNTSQRPRIAAQPALLTFKRPIGGRRARAGKKSRRERHKIREEIELRVADATALARIFDGLGMQPSIHYEKYRTTFRLPPSKPWAKGLLIELDETPIGTFVELEGPPKAIDRAASELGFSKKDYILKNYLRLNSEECRRRGLKVGDMVFPKKREFILSTCRKISPQAPFFS
jgi:adenylate cyclase class 2